MIDGYNSDKKKLFDTRLFEDITPKDVILKDCVVHIDKDPSESGLSFFWLLHKGGHCTCHTYPFKGIYYADIFSDIEETSFFDCYDAKNVEKNERVSILDYGMHFQVTISVSLTSIQILQLLEAIPNEIGMSKISKAYTVTSGEHISGIILISTSHIAIHSNAKSTYFDIFSCKRIDKNLVIKTLSKYGEIIDTKIFFRGRK